MNERGLSYRVTINFHDSCEVHADIIAIFICVYSYLYRDGVISCTKSIIAINLLYFKYINKLCKEENS